MSDLRKQLDSAAAEYRTMKYPGDLSTRLLDPHLRLRPASPLWWRFAPLVTGAIAALVAVAVWQHRPTSVKPLEQVVHLPVAPATTTVALTNPFERLHGVRYEIYVTEMRSGMREAVSQLSDNVDVALDAPLVTDSVKSVRHVAGELQEFALVTWSQLRPRREPGC